MVAARHRCTVDDDFSRKAHERVFDEFHHGRKVEITKNIVRVSFLNFSERWLNQVRIEHMIARSKANKAANPPLHY